MATEIITGNYFNKYETQNIIYKKLTNRFLEHLLLLIPENKPLSILELGCGEGYLASKIIERRNVKIYRGIDIDAALIKMANEMNPSAEFKVASIYDLNEYVGESFDIVLCSEVLEHLYEPEKALQQFSQINSSCFVLSVPNEPLWSFLNMIRLKYWKNWGNTPGHVQNWSVKSFKKVVSRNLKVVEHKAVFPWQMAVCINL